ncbi:hypothetical protein [Luteolibacter sp. Populi]|uniref:hypothetical protein n=1 Tax=Luteolibacter sp. Populi TaxID=3230487 RepID=UPI0034673C40
MILPLGLALTLASGVAPAVSRWAQVQERRILTEGQPLAAEALAFATKLKIEDPEGVRVLEVPQVPVPVPQALIQMARGFGFRIITPAGMTLGRGIYILKGSWGVLRHELVHVEQYQRLGGIHPFMQQYLVECLFHGYEDAPLEIDAEDRSRPVR